MKLTTAACGIGEMMYIDQQLITFYRAYRNSAPIRRLDENELPELWEFEEGYLIEHPEFIIVLNASTSEERRRAFDASGLESCVNIVRTEIAMDVLRFFDVSTLNDLNGDGGIQATILRRLQDVAADESESDEHRHFAWKLRVRCSRWKHTAQHYNEKFNAGRDPFDEFTPLGAA